ncbi:MAG: hypothetical protein K0R38_5068 [Polyangiaceae bacterium]|nr:hypothetical protein [Polyangiaceae bacterium]
MSFRIGSKFEPRRQAAERLSNTVEVLFPGALSAVKERVSKAVQPCVDEAW